MLLQWVVVNYKAICSSTSVLNSVCNSGPKPADSHDSTCINRVCVAGRYNMVEDVGACVGVFARTLCKALLKNLQEGLVIRFDSDVLLADVGSSIRSIIPSLNI